MKKLVIILFLSILFMFSQSAQAYTLIPIKPKIDIIIPNFSFLLGACVATKVTNNGVGDFNPSIHNGTVAWEHGSYPYEIYIWDTEKVTSSASAILGSSYSIGGGPSVYDGKVVWGNNSKIKYFNGTAVSNFATANEKYLMNPSFYNGNIAYDAESPDNYGGYVLFYNKSSIYVDDHEMYPSLYNGKIAFQAFDGHDYEIFFWNGSSLSQITDNDYNDKYPSLYETSIAWQGLKDDNYDIFYYDGSSATTQITHAGRDVYPSLYKGKVVWEGTDGNDREIFQWDGSKIIQVTNNSFHDSYPSYYNGYLAWKGDDGDSEIYYCDLDSPKPPSVVLNSASNINTTSANLSGTVNPNGVASTYYFQYGTTISYSGHTSAFSAGSGSVPVDVSTNISGLTPYTTYHYRLVAVNENGTKYSVDKTFKTLAQTTPDTPAPSGQSSFNYLPVSDPTVSTVAADMKPMGVGNIQGGVLNLKVALPKFSSPVDVYLGVYSSSLDPEHIFIFQSDNSLIPLGDILIPWKSNLSGSLSSTSLYGDINLSALPAGTYNFYVFITPAGNQGSYYLWSTFVSF